MKAGLLFSPEKAAIAVALICLFGQEGANWCFANEVSFIAGSPGHVEKKNVSAESPIVFNYSQHVVHSCGGKSEKEHSETCVTPKHGEEILPEIDLGVEQIAEGDTTEDVLELIEGSKEYFRAEVLVKPEYESVREECKNRHGLCSFWAQIGECDANPAYMRLQCAPACRTCKLIDIRHRCPMDPNVENALAPGDLNTMFESIIESKKNAKYSPTILSRPSVPSESGEENGDSNDGPWMLMFSNFISSEEAERMIELSALEGYERSMDVGNKNFDGTYDGFKSSQRTSENSWCKDVCYNDTVAQSIMERIADVTGIPEKNSEYLQLLRYHEGEFYGTHHDGIPHQLERQSGLRILTFYIYLNDVEEGGGTNFPRLDLTVTPKRGNAVLWPSVLNKDPDVLDDRTEHQALPVIKGVKYGANAWIHQRDYKAADKKGCT